MHCCQISIGNQGNIPLHCIFLLGRRTLDENICLSWLKFNLSRAPGQVIFLPLIVKIAETQSFNTNMQLLQEDFKIILKLSTKEWSSPHALESEQQRVYIYTSWQHPEQKLFGIMLGQGVRSYDASYAVSLIWIGIWIAIRDMHPITRTFIFQYNKAHHICIHFSVIVWWSISQST